MKIDLKNVLKNGEVKEDLTEDLAITVATAEADAQAQSWEGWQSWGWPKWGMVAGRFALDAVRAILQARAKK